MFSFKSLVLKYKYWNQGLILKHKHFKKYLNGCLKLFLDSFQSSLLAKVSILRFPAQIETSASREISVISIIIFINAVIDIVVGK